MNKDRLATIGFCLIWWIMMAVIVHQSKRIDKLESAISLIESNRIVVSYDMIVTNWYGVKP